MILRTITISCQVVVQCVQILEFFALAGFVRPFSLFAADEFNDMGHQHRTPNKRNSPGNFKIQFKIGNKH